ncbi:hypothetical protein ACIPZF_04005 [Pseudomonas sp. NPDC089752]|uniref:hypothetical protein n=1 Tax=Pseudomonas sp. NPDC089752 TaxID=3364472 RepID=UPI00381631BA
MNSDIETRMWEMAWHVYGDSLGEILSLALAGYKRSSGLDDLTRLYPNHCWASGAADFAESVVGALA